MYSKFRYIAGFGLLAIVLNAFPYSSIKLPIMLTQKANKINGAAVYQQNFKDFTYYIETIGTVSIDEVSLKDGKLTAIYSYKQGSETRQVVSALTLDKENIYKGTCTTKVNEKVLFAVNTWLKFKDDGTANGNWSWSGSPSINDPIVNISKR